MSTPTRRPLDYRGAADYVNTTERHLRSLVQRREIPYVKLGRLVRFIPDQLDDYLEAQTVPRAS